ncbi:SDR family NAD(P)-dependent oxidoreductase [Ancylobacter vacuolatus]|uniref:NAD(P)-dependent dehydrogenase (Short-subunit alcohol dehydrogenase family) n=1 Tax=Ancylobacter vacuolatus TaxID=223389 RepID=A0ABU0DKT3_9HYPH|nr:SDR family oxidoreductase [Ancylobacter vacuolatus]MDQ0349043.1 NAD(P)-dependent dehydrogenase (short-subunit alcohol dehydrogenase family) [Ancylobacter vacuolatus]
MQRHTGRRVLITGAGNGIGMAAARFFAGEGARLCLVDIDAEALAATIGTLPPGTEALSHAASVTDEAAIAGVVEAMVTAYGGIDAVVNSAGVVVVEPALEARIDIFREVIEVNLIGTWIVCQAAARHMAQAGSGSIVNISSVYGFQGAPARTAYCASKGGVVNLTNSLAVEWGPLGIRVNSVAPTGTRTPMVQGLIDRGIYDVDAVSRRTPLRRIAEPDEVAAACGFLVSDEAGMTTGHHLAVDGGWLANGFLMAPKTGA